MGRLHLRLLVLRRQDQLQLQCRPLANAAMATALEIVKVDGVARAKLIANRTAMESGVQKVLRLSSEFTSGRPHLFGRLCCAFNSQVCAFSSSCCWRSHAALANLFSGQRLQGSFK